MSDLLQLNNVTVRYPGKHGQSDLVALDDVSLAIRTGETLGLVGESGSGKTTLSQVALQLLQPTSGTVTFENELVTSENRRRVMSDMQVIFQDPYESLNPKQTALQSVREPLQLHYDKQTATQLALAALASVGLDENDAQRYPATFSGGQRQRIGIARAVAVHPKFIVADEPISALDVSIQAQVLKLMAELQASYNLTYLFISHDLSKVRQIADRIAVLYFGHLVELGPVEEIFQNPMHAYTRELLAAIPEIGKSIISFERKPIVIGNEWVQVTPEHYVLR
ncbi:ABC transporter ATP-binding protein [Weissella confusa]|jgi:ABC-type oligopeptide transport system ATPase subunit|uniref:ATP-binding cassette domain-containing protein n=1 Tax=Weissella confusa TaxID=1583 RepID=UPI00107FCABA|nr:ATP-binding cassette domain-containing protein [Weissella confusa]MBJ7646548.1 ABC transporter ATP-binding protein [Weissella confusa]MBJ7679043.1 ABC transporter ATP-binding protein [Weissella confusa]QBZ03009.1 peptide ABC transporter ATP-binding protein [Weissella confusa]TGE60466.1 peptide ABC transporter ATP-binding protein [Weissella confusa]TGE68634.1 peptide ABC transporter ATP-binding protein [Weissella confusa]